MKKVLIGITICILFLFGCSNFDNPLGVNTNQTQILNKSISHKSEKSEHEKSEHEKSEHEKSEHGKKHGHEKHPGQTPPKKLNLPISFTGAFVDSFSFELELPPGKYMLKVSGLYGVAYTSAKMDAGFEWYGTMRKHGMWSWNNVDGRYGRGQRPVPDGFNTNHVYNYPFEITETTIETIVNMDDRWDDNIGSLTFEFCKQ